MKNIKKNLWNYYLTFPINKKIKRRVFFCRFKRFLKSVKLPIKLENFYDFFFIKIIKKDFLKWAVFFQKNKIIFK